MCVSVSVCVFCVCVAVLFYAGVNFVIMFSTETEPPTDIVVNEQTESSSDDDDMLLIIIVAAAIVIAITLVSVILLFICCMCHGSRLVRLSVCLSICLCASVTHRLHKNVQSIV